MDTWWIYNEIIFYPDSVHFDSKSKWKKKNKQKLRNYLRVKVIIWKRIRKEWIIWTILFVSTWKYNWKIIFCFSKKFEHSLSFGIIMSGNMVFRFGYYTIIFYRSVTHMYVQFVISFYYLANSIEKQEDIEK